jgi:hypothetical protein
VEGYIIRHIGPGGCRMNHRKQNGIDIQNREKKEKEELMQQRLSEESAAGSEILQETVEIITEENTEFNADTNTERISGENSEDKTNDFAQEKVTEENKISRKDKIFIWRYKVLTMPLFH